MKITDDIFKSIFSESVWISITISLKFIPKGPIDYTRSVPKYSNYDDNKCTYKCTRCVVEMYRQISNTRQTKFQNLNVYHLVLQLPLSYLLKPGVRSRSKM